MAAPSIPNLLGLKAHTSRGGGGGGQSSAADAPLRRRRPKASRDAGDAVVQQTDSDAAMSRLSAVHLGYLDDAYARSFAPGPLNRRLPIINRGTYVRTRALDMIISAFIGHSDGAASGGPKQIISLGAGTDTRPFHLLGKHRPHELVYHEIDFESTCRKKLEVVCATPPLARDLSDLEVASGGSWSARWRQGSEYHCHAVDLRTIQDSLQQAVGGSIRTNMPTLVLSECCLCYLSPQDSERVLNFFQSRIAQLAVVVYEPMPLDDDFGRIMLSNLQARQIYMPSAEQYKNELGQEQRLRAAGLDTVGHATIKEAWRWWIDKVEKARVDALEGLDEVEEWELLAAHYVVAWGSQRTGFGDFGRDVMAASR